MSCHRRPALELLLALARLYDVPLDDLVGAPTAPDPRVRLRSRRVDGRVVWPLTPRPPSSTPACRTGSAPPGTTNAEILVLFGRQGERIHLRAQEAGGA